VLTYVLVGVAGFLTILFGWCCCCRKSSEKSATEADTFSKGAFGGAFGGLVVAPQLDLGENNAVNPSHIAGIASTVANAAGNEIAVKNQAASSLCACCIDWFEI